MGIETFKGREHFYVWLFFRILEPGIPISDSVGNQDAHFFRVKMIEEFEKHGVVIRCKSSASSKFKLVMFDKEGLNFLKFSINFGKVILFQVRFNFLTKVLALKYFLIANFKSDNQYCIASFYNIITCFRWCAIYSRKSKEEAWNHGGALLCSISANLHR